MDRINIKFPVDHFRKTISINLLLLILCSFVLLNSIKIDFIDHFVIFPESEIPITYLSIKFLFYLIFGSLITISLLRCKSVIPLLIIYGLQTLYLFIHFSHALYFDAPFHARQFFVNLHEGILLVRHFSIPMNIKYFTVIADFPVLVLIIFNYSKIKQSIKSDKKINNSIVILFVAFFLAFVIFSYRVYQNSLKEDMFYGEMQIIEKVGLVGNDVLDLILYSSETSVIKDFRYGNELAFQNKTTNRVQNIICVQVESLDSNIVDYKYKTQYIAPFLHQLSSNCIYYPYMIPYHLAGASSDTEFSVINSLVPASRLPFYRLRNYSYPNSFLKRLVKSHFGTIAFHNNEGNFFNRKTTFFKMGFQEFDDIADMRLEENGWGAPDREMFNFVKEKLKKQKTPFLYYIVTMSSHEPFSNVKRYYINNLYEDIRDKDIKNYFNSLSYVDSVLKDFVGFVKENLKDTYVFIYGDHDAYTLQDRGSFKNKGVPLFIITPDNKVYRETVEIASSLDLAPTILYASGVNFRLKTDGANLLNFPIKNGLINITADVMVDRKSSFGSNLPVIIHSSHSSRSKYSESKKAVLP